MREYKRKLELQQAGQQSSSKQQRKHQLDVLRNAANAGLIGEDGKGAEALLKEDMEPTGVTTWQASTLRRRMQGGQQMCLFLLAKHGHTTLFIPNRSQSQILRGLHIAQHGRLHFDNGLGNRNGSPLMQRYDCFMLPHGRSN